VTQHDMAALYQLLGKIEANLCGLDLRLKNLEANTEFIRAAHESNGRAVASIEERCRLRGKQISEIVRKVGGVEEITGVIKIHQLSEESQRRLVRWLVGVGIALLSILVSFLAWRFAR